MGEFVVALVAAVLMAINGPVDSGPLIPAVRLNPPVTVETLPSTTVPQDSCETTRGIVNSLPYEWGNLAPVHFAYNLVASTCLDWDQATIDRWEAFLIDDVVKEESGGCWNVLRKGQWTGTGCDFTYPNGSAEDAGFFQLVGVWHGPDGYLCVNFGTCGRNAVIASPFDSMISGLRAIMHDGSRPFCYDARARRFHSGCATVSRNWPD